MKTPTKFKQNPPKEPQFSRVEGLKENSEEKWVKWGEINAYF